MISLINKIFLKRVQMILSTKQIQNRVTNVEHKLMVSRV